MAYTKNEKGDAPKMRRGGRRRKKSLRILWQREQ